MEPNLNDKVTMERLSEHSVRIRRMELIESEIEWIKKYFESKLSDIEKRTELARLGMEKRLDGMNEFREALREQSSKSPTRVEMDSEIESLRRELKDFSKYREDRASLPVDVVSLKGDVRALNTFKDTLAGSAKQSDVNRATVISVISLVIGIIGLLTGLLIK